MTTQVLNKLAEVADRFPEAAKDAKLNLKSVTQTQFLSPIQAWGTALACAYNEGRQELVGALLADGAEVLDQGVIDDARAAAALMSMNNVYYRFRHMVDKPIYTSFSARLRMTWIARPATDRATFELFCLAVSAINGCEMCIRSHEGVLTQHGVKEEAIHEAVRIAAVIRSASTCLQFCENDTN